MISQISQTHPCSGKCKRFKGEQCNTCLIPEPEFVNKFQPASEILKHFESLEAAQQIVDNNPDAHVYCQETRCYYNNISDELRKQWGTISLADLRAAIDEYESSQSVADLKQRVKKAKHALSTFNYKPEVCVEEETTELFQSLHCSPRDRAEQEPTARDAIMEFMRFPGNAQPYCPACTRKDHDLRLLKMLHAEDKYTLETKIMMRNVIIGLLLIIVVLLAVALVGAL